MPAPLSAATPMTQRRFLQLDVFADRPGAGNPLGGGGGCRRPRRRRRCRRSPHWTNLSETIFLLPPVAGGRLPRAHLHPAAGIAVRRAPERRRGLGGHRVRHADPRQAPGSCRTAPRAGCRSDRAPIATIRVRAPDARRVDGPDGRRIDSRPRISGAAPRRADARAMGQRPALVDGRAAPTKPRCARCSPTSPRSPRSPPMPRSASRCSRAPTRAGA